MYRTLKHSSPIPRGSRRSTRRCRRIGARLQESWLRENKRRSASFASTCSLTPRSGERVRVRGVSVKRCPLIQRRVGRQLLELGRKQTCLQAERGPFYEMPGRDGKNERDRKRE